MSLIIYGANDDLIELDGDIYEEFHLEFHLSSDDSIYVATQHGFVIEIVYRGDWKIMPLRTPNTEGSHYNYYIAGTDKAVELSGGSDYTDVIELLSDEKFEWALAGNQYVKSGKKAKL